MKQLGGIFAQAALGPVAYAGQCIMSRNVNKGLKELESEHLMASMRRGVKAVAKAVGVAKSDVMARLPSSELYAIAQRLDVDQKESMRQWKLHTGDIGTLLTGVADLTVDGRSPDAGLCLYRLSQKLHPDKALSEPLHRLSTDVDAWIATLEVCREKLDSGSDLILSYRRARMIRLASMVVLLMVLVGAGGWLGRRHLARQRIEAALDGPICNVEQIDEGDLNQASAAQFDRATSKRKKCRSDRLAAEEEAKRRVQKQERSRKAVAAAKKRLADCEQLAKAVVAGDVAVMNTPVATHLPGLSAARLALLRRIAQRKIVPADLSGDVPRFCVGTSAEEAIAKAFSVALVRTAPEWLPQQTPSPSVLKELSAGRPNVTPNEMFRFDRGVEKVALDAAMSGDPKSTARAKTLCKLKHRLAQPHGFQCAAVMSTPAQE